MTQENAKWELKILLNAKIRLKENGREIDYYDDNRIKELRVFLDSLNKEVFLPNTQGIEESPF